MNLNYFRRSRILCGALIVICLCASSSPRVYAQKMTADPAPNVARSNYILAPSDLLEVKVYQEDDLETKVRVARDGSITFPLIGAVKVGGKSPQEAAETIRDRLARGYLINPQVTVNVLEYTKYRLTVLGQVQKPGSYDFPDRERLTLLEAIGLAGGYTRGANPSKVVIKRLVNGQETVLQVDAKTMASQGSAKGFEVQPGDVITVAESIF